MNGFKNKCEIIFSYKNAAFPNNVQLNEKLMLDPFTVGAGGEFAATSLGFYF